MTNWKHYAGSILLAGLLLQGCGDSAETTTAATTDNEITTLERFNASSSFLASAIGDDVAAVESDLILKLAQLDATNPEMTNYIDGLIADNAQIVTRMDAYTAITETITSNSANGAPSRSIFSDIGDSLKDGLVDIMDSSVGDAITSATFDVVLNSEGVTVFMLDQARNSETMTQIMIDALDADWSLTKKMCPMLQENAEFGEKFAALAEERESMAHFFFQSVDANMYGCLTDAMLLSNNDAVHHESVSHSTNAYMGILLERYATTYFITPDQATNPNGYENGASTFKFAGLMMDNGENVIYDSETKTFENHGDANELTNEQFFYSLFKTPGTTDAFVAAMDQLDPAVTTMFMDKIFLGAPGAAETDDTVQGYLNIISIGSAMYDGIYGEKNAEGVRVNAYGFGSYTDAFMGFAGLIPSDRYLAYGKAFMDAGYMYAGYNGINVWDSVTNTAQSAWDDYTAPAPEEEAAGAPSRSAGLGTLGSDWLGDITNIFVAGWGNFSLTAILDAFTNEDTTVIGQIKEQSSVAYATVLDGRNDANETVYPTTISNGVVHNDTVYGLHGLIELAMQEDIYAVYCGNKSTDYIGLDAPTCENNASYTITDAKASFTLPPIAEITWSFAYTSAKDGAVAYYNNFVDAGWLADLSDNELIRQYFYPSADNVYIPSWLLAIDWLKFPDNFNNAEISATDFNYDAGFMDIYVVSPNSTLLETNTTVGDINLASVVSIVKTIEVSAIDMGSDSIIAVDENGQTLDGLYVYKVRTITPEDTAAVMAYLSGLGDSALAAIGIDSTNAAETVATAE